MDKKRFCLVTIGCRTNQYETQLFREQLIGIGYQEVVDGERADLCIINTCTVTASADRISKQKIRQLVEQNSGARVVVTGCLATKHPNLKEEIEGVSDLIPNRDKENLMRLLFPEGDLSIFSISRFALHTRAFIKVQDGCNSFCTYCIIPYVRGRSRSRKMEDIVAEVEKVVSSGYQEIVLTGINLGDFNDDGRDLADLISSMDGVSGLKRVRLSSIDPTDVNDRVIESLINGKNTCHHLHLVLQSGSDVILKKMNRKYSRELFLDVVKELRSRFSDFVFTTDVIVGFPGEGEKEFEDTLSVIKEVKFAKVHMFPYSKRERTRASLYQEHVAQDVVERRKEQLLALSKQEAFNLRENYVGKSMTILMESKTTGHSDNFLHVKINKPLQPNKLVVAHIVQNGENGLVGRVE